MLLHNHLEKRFPAGHLGEDAANGPDVDGAGVLRGAQQDFRSSIPECHDLKKKFPLQSWDLIANDTAADFWHDKKMPRLSFSTWKYLRIAIVMFLEKE